MWERYAHRRRLCKLINKNPRIYEKAIEILNGREYNIPIGGINMEIKKSTLRKIFIGTVICIVIYWLLHETNQLFGFVRGVIGLISPLILGAAIAFILNVPMRAFENLLKKIKKLKSIALRRSIALVLTILALLLILFGIFYLLIPQLGKTVESLGKQLPAFMNGFQAKVVSFLEANPQLKEMLGKYTDVNVWNWGALIQNMASTLSGSFGSVVDAAFSTVVNIGNGIFDAVMSVFFAFYCLMRKEILARQGRRLLYALLPEHISDQVIRVCRMSNSTFSKFISGQCLEAVILGAMFAVTMPIFGMPYAALISVIIAFTALVPIVGAFVGCFIGAFFILVESPVMAFWFVVLFLVLQQIEGNLIYPRVVGNSIGLPGMWVLVAVVVGGNLMGISGMLVMIPLASVCYSLTREFIGKRLEKKQIVKEKLQDQPPDLKREKLKRKKEEKE